MARGEGGFRNVQTPFSFPRSRHERFRVFALRASRERGVVVPRETRGFVSGRLGGGGGRLRRRATRGDERRARHRWRFLPYRAVRRVFARRRRSFGGVSASARRDPTQRRDGFRWRKKNGTTARRGVGVPGSGGGGFFFFLRVFGRKRSPSGIFQNPESRENEREHPVARRHDGVADAAGGAGGLS